MHVFYAIEIDAHCSGLRYRRRIRARSVWSAPSALSFKIDTNWLYLTVDDMATSDSPQPFYFMELPPELSLIIYEMSAQADGKYFDATPVEWRPEPCHPVTVGLPGWEETTAERFPVADVHRLVRSEALPVRYTNCSLTTSVYAQNLELCRRWIRKQDDIRLVGI